MSYILWFDAIRLTDNARVGGKNSSLGEMIYGLTSHNILVPQGFAITVDAYTDFLHSCTHYAAICNLLEQLANTPTLEAVHSTSRTIREYLEHSTMPVELVEAISTSYRTLSEKYGSGAIAVAVRSSATAEDLPDASFAGQQETYLNIYGVDALLDACKRCFASLFTERALIYRQERSIDHMAVGLSIGVQKMVRSDLACAGVAFSLEPESGFHDFITINGAYGLGELVVQGHTTPDEYTVHKKTLALGYRPLIQKKLGRSTKKLMFNSHGTGIIQVPVEPADQQKFCLTDQEVLELASSVHRIEEYYSKLAGRLMPMDIEWAKDGLDNKLYIVQARPETVHSRVTTHMLRQYTVDKASVDKAPIAYGQSVGHAMVTGIARVITSIDQAHELKPGEILVTVMTDPDWGPAMRRAAGIITDQGGRTCHAAIVSRELGKPAIIGTGNGTTVLHTGDTITIDTHQGSTGFIYPGALDFSYQDISLEHQAVPPVPIMLNIGDPAQASTLQQLPVAGVGLARLEFIISQYIGIHPNACLDQHLLPEALRKKIAERSYGYATPREFFVETLASGIGMIAGAFYPRPVIIRLSDFKSNEYRNLLGGELFEQVEENPMLGLRGASRYYSPQFHDAFLLEVAAIRKNLDMFGFTNIALMVPFVRTVTEAARVKDILAQQGLIRGKRDTKLYMMCEIPSNVLLMDKFCAYFDGFSIGSNDLTQLTLGVDRDAGHLATLFDERDEAVKKFMSMAITTARAHKKYISICGQAPSDYPEIADFLIEQGIDAISLNSDAILPFLAKFSHT